MANGVVLDVEPTLFEADRGDPKKALLDAVAAGVRPFLEMADAYSWAEYVNGDYAAELQWADRAQGTGWKNALFLFHRRLIENELGRTAQVRGGSHPGASAQPHFNVLPVPVARPALA